MRDIMFEPVGKVYENLIRYAVDTSDAFMFIIHNYSDGKDYIENTETLIDEIMPLMLKKEEKTGEKTGKVTWPNTTVRGDENLRVNFMVFKSDIKALNFLLKPGSLYKWRYPYFPEDISFFRKGYNWLATTAHEQLAHVCGVEETEYKKLEDLGIIFDSRVFDDKYCVYFEEY